MRRVALGRRAMGAALALAAFVGPLDDASAHRGGWDVLGEKRVGIGLDRDVIELERRDGRFDALKLQVRNGNIMLLGMTIVYGNGVRQDFRAGVFMRDGAETQAIDLKGESRFLQRVELRYGTLDFGGSRAAVTVLGRRAAEPRRRDSRPVAQFRDLGPRWQRVGVQRVEGRRDVDVIDLDVGEQLYDAVVLRVMDGEVRLRDMRVRYGNGEEHDLSSRERLYAGDSTDVKELRLAGRNEGRFIDSIELRYGSRRSGPRGARVEVWARKAKVTRRRLGRRWEELGSDRVGRRGAETETIRVGRSEGRFAAIILHADGGNVALRSVRVTYGNGRREELPARQLIPAGGASEVLKLRSRNGRGRRVRKIDLVYARLDNRRRPATVTVYGRRPR